MLDNCWICVGCMLDGCWTCSGCVLDSLKINAKLINKLQASVQNPSRIHPKFIPNSSKIHPKCIQNPSQIHPKSIKNRPCVADTFLERPGVVLGWLRPLAPDPFGDHLSIKRQKKQPQGRPKGAQSWKMSS